MEAEEPVSNHATNFNLCPIKSWQHMISTLHCQHGNLAPSIQVNNFKKISNLSLRYYKMD